MGFRYGLRLGKQTLAALVDVIWPPRSLLSDEVVDRPGVIEPELWAELQFLGPPQCAACGFPFPEPSEAELLEGALCGACLAERPPFAAARAALAYDDHARALALGLKRGARRDGLTTFAGWMAQALGPLAAEVDLIVPVPLHWTKLATRGFNQAAWLAQALGRRLQMPVAVAGMTRAKRRRSQAGLTAAQRNRNVRGAFRAGPGVKGKVVLLVDDVFTTGATAAACARALSRAGAEKVYIITLARVTKPAKIDV
jgi:ComF family protein